MRHRMLIHMPPRGTVKRYKAHAILHKLAKIVSEHGSF